jgi:putative FmdB family regulatory protein
MPAYDYRCPECGKEQEITHGMMEDPEVKCSVCNRTMRRVFRSFLWHFAGNVPDNRGL